MDDARRALALSKAIASLARRIGGIVRLMEVCGTHTVAIFRHGIRGLLPGSIRLLSGPGCPVCVTPAGDVDAASAISKMPGVALLTFGDMMRVPGTKGSLNEARAGGGDVRVVYSPLDALIMAGKEKERKFVFFATGFETTSPLVAATLLMAERDGVRNFLVYPAHKLVPPALGALLGQGGPGIDGFVLPGHVSAVIGSPPYAFIAEKHRIPSVITGFGAIDILEGILMLLKQIADGVPEVQIQYASVVKKEGNPKALETIFECFEPAGALWRGIGKIPGSGLALKPEYRRRDASVYFGLGCSCGEVLRGLKAPPECPLFARACTPERPIGPCMVSAEGSCAAHYRYGPTPGGG